ncbi:antirepressor [Longimycelium tulufanense]|uniref:Antirepressor n=1 Tax=Longimycelium tulufanense TaxID=907463 RepID=A0A8J3FZA0_9PSEU|nr:phage antirepressor KilAC domain-containing protein [Longimycelium tulufanense]GGM78349.1 antirepressor [Longimycelium tulufanense]
MNDTQTFQFGGTEVRAVLRDGEPWFVGRDICWALGITNPSDALAKQVPAEWKGVETVYTPGGPQRLSVVNESGAYRLIMRSNKPQAVTFQNWLAGDVLPQLRRTGRYDVAEAAVERGVELPALLKQTTQALEQMIALNREQAAKITADAPKVEAFDAAMSAAGCHPLNAAAKVLGHGPNRFTARLRELGVLMYVTNELGGRCNVPQQRHIDAGRFVLKTYPTWDAHGRRFTAYTTYVTPKGLEWLRSVLGALATL